jgi:hypothetical protein
MRRLKRPQFSMRTLAIVVSAICVYFGAWEMTKRLGVRDTTHLLQEYADNGRVIVAAITPPAEESPMPFVIRRAEYGYMSGTYQYYLWFFGFRWKAPYERPMADAHLAREIHPLPIRPIVGKL